MEGFDLAGMLETIATLATTWGLKLLGAIAVFAVGRAVAKWARKSVRKALKKGDMDETLIPFTASLVYYLVLAFVVIAVLGMVGIQTASIIAVLGAAGLAVGLALQGTLSNFAAGVMLLVFRPFGKGDFIEAGGVKGTVQSIGIFTTQLNTPDNVGIWLPNSKVWGDKIHNFAANDTRRVDLVVGIDYGDDIQTAIDTIRRVLDKDDRVLSDPAPVIAVDNLGASSVDIIVRPWCKREDYWQLKWDLTRTFKTAIEAAGCSFPFPQRDVHLHQEASA